ncbi:MAG: mechanosensitive ion channel [Deltaproteobacteria bacterium]|nr:mechanosensitive ion channel [Deltaproteobacteria bacterium]
MNELQSLQSLVASPVVRSIAFVLTIAIGMSLVIRVIRRAIQRRVTDNDLRYRASKLVSVIGYAIVVAIVIAEVGGRMSGFTVALGAASAGIAFALQEVIASFAGWLAVALGGFFRVGDRVQLGGIKGDVIDIGFIRTTIMEIGSWVNGDLYNGRIVRVANSFVFKEPVYNYSGEFPFVWDEIVVPIKYGSDYAYAREVLAGVAHEVVGEHVASAKERWAELVRAYRIEDARVEPLVTVVANDNWVEFTLRYVVDHRARRLTKDRLFSQVLARVEESGGRIGMASMTVHLVEAPAFNVKVTNGTLTGKEKA